MSAGRIIGAVFKRTWVKVIRRPMILLLSFVQPITWMLFFGFLFHRFNLGIGNNSISYIDFLLPGICAMTVLLGASQSGIGLVRDIQTEFLARLLATPAGYHWLLVGKLAADVLRLLLQAVVVCLLGLLLGANLRLLFPTALAALLCLALFATGYACLSCYIALRTRSQEGLAAFVHVVNMPLFFTSTALVPANRMPSWLETIATWNPFSLVVNSLRQALLFGSLDSVMTTVVALTVAAGLLFRLASRAMKATG